MRSSMRISSRLRAAGVLLVVCALGAAVGWQLSPAPQPADATPRSGVPCAFWALNGQPSVVDAVSKVSACAGFDVELPSAVPSTPALEVVGVGVQPQASQSSPVQTVVDYFPRGWRPGAAEPATSRVQIVQMSHEATADQTAVKIDTGVTGWTLYRSAASRDDGPSTYLLVGHGKSFLVGIWGAVTPSTADSLALVRSLAR